MSENPKPRAIIAKDHRLILAGLEMLLASEFEVLLATNDFSHLVDAVRQLQPDLVVQGLSKQPSVGLQVVSEVRQLLPSVPIAVVSQNEDPKLAADALERGATAYLLTSCSEAELLDGLHAALAHRTYIAPAVAGELIRVLTKPASDVLSERQIEVVRLLAGGKSMKEVGRQLQMTTRTVAFHKYAAMRKLRISSTALLVRFAVKHGIV